MQRVRYAGIFLSAAALVGLVTYTPVNATPGPGNDGTVVASVKPPRNNDGPRRNGGGNDGGARQQQQQQQQRAAQERASQQRAAQERASQERAAQQRTQQRAAEERAAQQRSQERAAQERASQEHASEDAARRRADEVARQRQNDQQQRSMEDARQREQQDRIDIDRLRQQREAIERQQNDDRQRESLDRSGDNSQREEAIRRMDDLRERSSGTSSPDRDIFRDSNDGRDNNIPSRDQGDRERALDDMRKRLDAVRSGDRAPRDSDPPKSNDNDGRSPQARDRVDDKPRARTPGQDNGGDADRDISDLRDNRDQPSDLRRDNGVRNGDNDDSRIRTMPGSTNSGRNLFDDSSRKPSNNNTGNIDRARDDNSGPDRDLLSGPDRLRNPNGVRQPGAALDRQSLDRRDVDLTRHSNHLNVNQRNDGPPTRLPLHNDSRHVNRDADIEHRIHNSVHFNHHGHHGSHANHWVHHPHHGHHNQHSHGHHDSWWLHFSTGGFGFGFNQGHGHGGHHFWGHHHYLRPVYYYPTYCDWYYGSWYRPYLSVQYINYTPSYAYNSYDSYDDSYSSGGLLVSDNYDDSGTTVFGDDIFADELAAPTIDDAWQLLVDGYLTEAREMFVELGAQYPLESEPQIGYALAAGLLNDDESAVASLRQAMNEQPEAIVLVPQNLAMENHLQRLLARWEEKSRSEATADAFFMVAAIRFMLHEDAVAYFAIDEAIAAGDADGSAQNLKDVIRASMYETLYDE